jgi:hypothetical protein
MTAFLRFFGFLISDYVRELRLSMPEEVELSVAVRIWDSCEVSIPVAAY